MTDSCTVSQATRNAELPRNGVSAGRALGVVVAAAGAAILLGGAEAANVYHVDIDSAGGAASDTNPGTIGRPWKTISKANAAARAGDTVCLRRGTYRETIAPGASGTENAPITYRTHADEKVTITARRFGIDLVDRAHVTVDGINCDGTGEYVRLKNSHHVCVRNGTFDRSSMKTRLYPHLCARKPARSGRSS